MKHLGINMAKDVICWELQNIAEKFKNSINGEIYWVNGLEYSVLVRCQYSPNWSINSMQFQ